MKRQLLAVPIVGLLVVLAGCGFFRDAGAQTTQDREIQNVSGVRLLTSGNLTITVGSPEKLTVTAGANQQTGLTSQVIDGTLILDNKSSNTISGDISYALTVEPVSSLQISGSGNADGIGVLRGDATLTVSGSGNVTLSGLDLTSLTADLSGSGGVQLAGSATTQRVTVTGSGDYDASGLVSEQADVEADGSGSAKVDVSGRLTATSTGSGDITYTGNPSQVDKNSSGSGEITAG
jgi:Putative auto-transporter adhesin, head GIN domain